MYSTRVALRAASRAQAGTRMHPGPGSRGPEGEMVGRARGVRSVAGRQWDASQEEKSGLIILWMSFALIVGETCKHAFDYL